MKKIMFNDKFRLTKAVLRYNKTQTRRLVKVPKTCNGIVVRGFWKCWKTINRDGWWTQLYDEDENGIEGSQLPSPYDVGDIVAVAQRYSEKDVYEKRLNQHPEDWSTEAGWSNKMFVKAEYMPHQIKITNIRLERLQDISEADCLAEGIVKDTMEYPDEYHPEYFYHFGLYNDDSYENGYKTARAAYAALIDKICGKGTWESNPWVWVYDFELIK